MNPEKNKQNNNVKDLLAKVIMSISFCILPQLPRTSSRMIYSGQRSIPGKGEESQNFLLKYGEAYRFHIFLIFLIKDIF